MNMPTEKVALAVNQSNLIRALRDFFTNSRLTFSTEALQNARRAGATKVSIETYESEGKKCFRIQDDGCGITDWQKLLTVAESGWDEQVMHQDSPYGIGFLSLLFAAERCRVASNGKELNFACDTALDMKDLHIEPVSDIKTGTVVELIGLKKGLDEHNLKKVMLGFPIPIELNWEQLERPHAPETCQTVLPVGRANMPPLASYANKPMGHLQRVIHPEWVALYLQGTLVYSGNYEPISREFVVHLDSTRFFGRLPDRAQLVDQSDVLKQVEQSIEDHYRAELVKARAEMKDDEAFVSQFALVIKQLCPEMLNEVDVLPKEFLELPSEDYSTLTINSDNGFPSIGYGRNISRREVESGMVELYSIDYPNSDEADDFNLYGWHFLLHRAKACIVDGLPENHWATPYIVNLNGAGIKPEEGEEVDAHIEINVINPGKQKTFSGHYIYSAVQLCDAIEVNLMLKDGTKRTELVCDASIPEGTDGCGNAETIYVPAESNGSDACEQLSNYMGEHDQFMEGWRDEDCDKIAALVAQMRMNDPKDVLAHILKDKIYSLRNYEELHGQSFTVKVDEEGEFTVE